MIIYSSTVAYKKRSPQKQNLTLKWNLLLWIYILFLYLFPYIETYGIKFKHQIGFFSGYGLHSIFSQNLDTENAFLNGHFVSGGFFYNASHVQFARIQIEMLYTRKGSQSKTYNAYFDCLSFPILFRFQDYSGFLFKLGFGVTWIANAWVNDIRSSIPFNIEKDIQRFAHDVIFGLGWRFKLHKVVWIYIESRFTATVNNINQRFDDYENSLHPFNLDFFLGFEFLDNSKKNSKKKY